MSAIKLDENYEKELLHALTEAMVRVSRDPSTGVLAIRNAEVYSACIGLMATVSATSRLAETPEGIRMMANDLADRFAMLLTEVRAHYNGPGGMPGEIISEENIN